jgi:polyvinyl alcohol dehydrogenase (cytochrome)
MIWRLAICLMLLPATAFASEMQALYDSRCAHCHDGSTPKAPHQIKFQLFGADTIYAALTEGLMKPYAAGIEQARLRKLADFLGGSATATSIPVKRCGSMTLPEATPELHGWGFTPGNTRFVEAPLAGLSRDDVPNLRLKWVFAFPGATRARSQPVMYGQHLLVGSQSGSVYALELASGCAVWEFKADVEVRNAIMVDPSGQRAYFGDIKGMVYAIDPRNGALIWKALANNHPAVTLTGSPRLHDGVLYVPLSSSEWASAADPGYACCTFRGGVVAMDALNGVIRWTAHVIPEVPQPLAQQNGGQQNAPGVDRFHPAGAPVWNSPTIDVVRNRIYVGTGEAYTSPAAKTSDAVVAFDLKNGDIVWSYQSIPGDAWNMACYIGGGANCPAENGPDLDIGAPPVLTRLTGGQDVLIVGQKSGHVFALDPEDGRLLWRNRYGRGGFAGGVHWGLAVSPGTIFAPNADTVFTEKVLEASKPGLFAIDPADGRVKWFAPAPEVCAASDRPACDPGYSAPVTAIPGVVFAGAFDGHIRAHDASNGKILWDFNTHGEFPSVSGEIARGGSIESAGPLVQGGHVVVNSGYLFGDRMAGNALMVFTVPRSASGH